MSLPPDEENPLGATIYSHDQTPGMPRHEAVGLLRYTEARLLSRSTVVDRRVIRWAPSAVASTDGRPQTAPKR